MEYVFGSYQLNTDNHELRCEGAPVAVEPQVFELLRVLIENRQRTLLKDELMEMVWPGRVVSDAALSSRIKSARQAVGDDGKLQKLIKTVHGVGFRFVGQVSGTESVAAVSAVNVDQRPSILVLPFAGYTDNQTVLPQGLAHDIITGLSRLRWLKVIARASAFQLSTTSQSLEDIRGLTGARYCLSGCLEVVGKRLSIHLELVDMRDQAILWADRVAASLEDLHSVRADIITQTVSVLELQISSNEAQRALLKSPENLDAWESYHAGLSHLYRFNGKDNKAASALFQRAVAQEPDFARAHAGLSAAEFQNAFNLYPGVDREAAVQMARESAERSIDLDWLDPLANFVMGRIHWLSGDTDASLPWLERAIALNPNYAHGYYAHGLASLMLSQKQRGYEESSMALSLSPLDPFLYGFYGIRSFSYLADEDIANARLWAEKAASQPGAIAVIDLMAAATCELDGDIPRAKAWLVKATALKADINRHYFFEALPFAQGVVRSQIDMALARLGL